MAHRRARRATSPTRWHPRRYSRTSLTIKAIYMHGLPMPPPAMLDSDVHMWDLVVRDQPWIPAGSPIRRSFDVRDLRSALAGTPVDGVILVQVINDADETTDFVTCARNVDIVRGVGGWADLASPDFAAALSVLTFTGAWSASGTRPWPRPTRRTGHDRPVSGAAWRYSRPPGCRSTW
jgi:predicted TIM-barrel fold metal-dependent hydrolase